MDAQLSRELASGIGAEAKEHASASFCLPFLLAGMLWLWLLSTKNTNYQCQKQNMEVHRNSQTLKKLKRIIMNNLMSINST